MVPSNRKRKLGNCVVSWVDNQKWFIVYLILFFVILGMEPRSTCLLDKHYYH